jgi:hypothetical protein
MAKRKTPAREARAKSSRQHPPTKTTRQRPAKGATSDQPSTSPSTPAPVAAPASAEVPAADLRPASDQVHLAKCAKCQGSVEFRRTSHGHGFMVVTSHGFGDSPSFTVAKNGNPICPVRGHGAMQLADEQLVPASQAIAEVAAKTNGTAQQLKLIEPAPFNAEAALRDIAKERREASRRETVAEERHESYKYAKKSADEQNALVLRMIDEFDRRQQDHDAAVERWRERQAAHAAVPPVEPPRCSFEANTGKPCPICSADHPVLVVAAMQSANRTVYDDRMSEAHRAAAISANSKRVNVELKTPLLVRALGLVDIHIDASVVDTWTAEQIAEVLAWVTAGAIREHAPSAIGLPHIAGETGSGIQACLDCGARLVDMKTDGISYPKGAFVGVGCPGSDEAAGADLKAGPAQVAAETGSQAAGAPA